MGDLVGEMVSHMGLTPQMAEQMQAGVMPSYGNPGMQMSPEDQMRMMAAQPQGNMSIDSDSTDTTSSDVDIGDLGKSQGFFDNIMSYLKDPLVIAVLFIILSLTQVTTLLRRFLPALLLSNDYYFLAVRGVLMGALYLLTKMVIA